MEILLAFARIYALNEVVAIVNVTFTGTVVEVAVAVAVVVIMYRCSMCPIKVMAVLLMEGAWNVLAKLKSDTFTHSHFFPHRYKNENE